MAKRDTERELFAAFIRFARTSGLSLDDPALPAAFAAAVGSDLAAALRSAIWLHGNRVQNMFAAMVIAFDHHVLIKTEDAGEIEPKEGFALPDFRVVLKSGEQLLVEVKNVYDRRPERQRFSIKQRYLAKLQNYAQAVGTPLRLAVFFARWELWALIDPTDLPAKGDSLFIDMGAAMRVSEMAKIGDQTIGTRAPLQLRFLADRNKPRSIDDAQMLSMTIGAVKVYCQDTEVVSERDRAADRRRQARDKLRNRPQHPSVQYAAGRSDRSGRRVRDQFAGQPDGSFGQQRRGKRVGPSDNQIWQFAESSPGKDAGGHNPLAGRSVVQGEHFQRRGRFLRRREVDQIRQLDLCSAAVPVRDVRCGR
jgi:hypothetical protein